MTRRPEADMLQSVMNFVNALTSSSSALDSIENFNYLRMMNDTLLTYL